MGEYDAITGKMWQHEFTREQPTSFTLNTKEVLAAKISQELAPYYWMIHHAVSSTPYPCHLKTKGTQSYVSSWIQSIQMVAQTCHNSIFRSIILCNEIIIAKQTTKIKRQDLYDRLTSHSESGQRLLNTRTQEYTLQTAIQKNGQIEDQIAQWHTNDPELDPVKHWMDTITRLQSYPNYIHTCQCSTTSKISNKEIADGIKAAVDAIGPNVLGFLSKEVGTHSNRADFAMMSYLGKTPVYTIMLQGR
ncbi:LOW QUALITY PROTEIN: hypothetical protein ACHAXN_001846 [Cyclotella atomus]